MQEKPNPHDTINLDFLTRWENLVEDVDMHEVPIDYLKVIKLKMTNGTTAEIPVEDLLIKGYDPQALETEIKNKITELENNIEGVHYVVNVSAVAEDVEEFTENLIQRTTLKDDGDTN